MLMNKEKSSLLETNKVNGQGKMKDTGKEGEREKRERENQTWIVLA